MHLVGFYYKNISHSIWEILGYHRGAKNGQILQDVTPCRLPIITGVTQKGGRLDPEVGKTELLRYVRN